MPSIRVKKGYAPLSESSSGPESPAIPAARPRAWSLNVLGSPPFRTESRSQTHSRDEEADVGLRPHTFNEPNRPSLRRGSTSRVAAECSGTTRSAGPSQYRDFKPHRNLELPRMFDNGRRQPSTIPQDVPEGETVSFEGAQASVTLPADGRMGRVGSALSLHASFTHDNDPFDEDHHPDDVVEHLDVIDPQVSTVSTLTNAANTIVIPPMTFYSRKPVIVLSEQRRNTVSSGTAGPNEPHQDNLDRHVEDCLNKPDKFRRTMRGVWSFLKTPLGVITAIYGFNVVFWGAGIVLFLAKMINVHNSNTQGFWVELCQQIETGLFSLTSIGLMPFRIVDTYRICKIYRYKRKTARLRKLAGLPELYDPDDLPDPIYDDHYVHVLSEKEQIDLHYQQHKFMESQTWYRPHGTTTHRAFPIHYALLICALNDWNSIFQCMLSGCMWSMNRFTRPAWTTATTLPFAFICGILAGFYIYWGGRKTKRTEEVVKRLRAALEMDNPKDALDAITPPNGSDPSQSTTKSQSTKSESATPEMPHVKDYAVDEKPVQRQQTLPEVRITDEMTVPSAADLNGEYKEFR